MTFVKPLKATFIACAGLGLAIAPAAFATTSDKVSVEIDTRYLETDWGVEIVYDKLVKKSESACSTTGERGLQALRLAEDCASNLLDNFIVNARDETLTKYHAKMRS